MFQFSLVLTNYNKNITTTKQLCSDGVSNFSNEHLVTRVYSGLSVMSSNRPSLLWTSVATVFGDIISLPIVIVII
jgi:hypothetical protein